MASALSPVSRNVGSAAWPRSRKSLTESHAMSASMSLPSTGSDIDGTGIRPSPAMPSGSRLVVTIRRSVQRRSSASLSSTMASRTCSQLSKMSSARRPSSALTSAVVAPSGPGLSRRVDAAASGTSDASSRVENSTNQTPSGYWSTRCAPSSSASRVFPTPPGPVRVSSDVDATRSSASAISASRPTNVDSWRGRLFGRVSSDRTGGKSVSRPSATTWYSRTAAARSLSRCSPRSRNDTPSGTPVPMSARAASETRTCPPCPAEQIRAARWTSMPM